EKRFDLLFIARSSRSILPPQYPGRFIQTDAKSLAATVGLLKAIRDYDLRRLISFHGRVKGAEAFAEEIHKVQDWLPEESRLTGKLNSDYVSGEMPTDRRRQKLSHLKNVADGEVALLSNARCLSEGVDVPSLDGVAFIDPKNSQIDIIQAVGRAIRLSTNKTAGTIVLSVFIEKGDTAEDVIERSDFKSVWGVLAALKAHDETLASELNQLRTEMGRKGSNFKVGGINKVIFDLPTSIDQSFSDGLKAKLVEATTMSWDEWFGVLLSWREVTGSNIPEVAEEFGGRKLGIWVATQRTAYSRMLLSPERIKRLQALSGWSWDRVEELWEKGIQSLIAYWEENQSSRVPDRYIDPKTGLKLGQWVKTRRLDYARGKLKQERIDRLEKFPDWSWDPSADDWWETLAGLRVALRHTSLEEIERSRTINSPFSRFAVWIVRQKSCFLAWQDQDSKAKNYRRKLSEREVIALQSLDGWSWDRRRDAWLFNFGVLQSYLESHKIDQLIPTTEFQGVNLGRWLTKQRSAYKSGRLELWKQEKLVSVGWVPDPYDSAWESGFSFLLGFQSMNGHLLVPQSHIVDGFALGRWVSGQRINFHKGNLREDRKSRLQALEGWTWDASDSSAAGISKRGFSPSKLKLQVND
uniref:Helicase associated domain protein n=1 Tax=Shewanella sp. TaxID=50422 RepID=UPI00404853E5